MKPLVDVGKFNRDMLSSDKLAKRVLGELLKSYRVILVAFYPWSDNELMARRLQEERSELTDKKVLTNINYRV